MSERAMRPSIPQPALVLGAAGLIPFFAAALAPLAWGGADGAVIVARGAFAAYGALILSFLGGARWGLEMARPQGVRWPVLAWSVSPSLLAFALLIGVFVGGMGATLPLASAALFALVYGVDRSAVRAGEAPAWYLRLRLGLTLGVLTACALLWAAPLLTGQG